MTDAIAEVPTRRHDFRTDDEFAVLCPLQTSEERELLEASILAHGVREPLVVWREEKLLLDGHTRVRICDEHRLPVDVVEYSFPDRAAARAWVIDNQLGRRNLAEEQRRYLRGKRLLVEKKDKTENLREGDAPKHQSDASGKTAARIAEREGVSQATIERDAEYARAIDKISETCPKARGAILTGKLNLTREEVARAATAAPRSLGQVKRAAMTKPATKGISFDKFMTRAAASAAAHARPKEKYVRRIDTLGVQLAKAVHRYKMAGHPVAALSAVEGIVFARRMLAEMGGDAAATSGGARP